MTSCISIPNNFHIRLRFAFRIRLSINLPTLSHFNSHVLRQSRNNRNTDAVQPSRNRIRLIIKLTSSMQLRNNNFHRRSFVNRMKIDRHPPTVVANRHRAILINPNINHRTNSRHVLINGIIHNLINKMMKPILISRTNIHARPLSNRLETFQNSNILC